MPIQKPPGTTGVLAGDQVDAPEHLEGMRGASTIIAVNTDKHAPIFGVAHYGLVEDLFDVCEDLTEQIEER